MQDFSNISPYIHLIWDHTVSEPFTIEERELFDYELLYIKSGKIIIEIEGQTYEGTEGSLFILRPRQKHSMSFFETPVRQPHIHFDFYQDALSPMIFTNFKTYEHTDSQYRSYYRKNILDTPDFTFPSMIKLKDPLTFEKLFYALLHEHENNLHFHDLACKGLMIEIWSFVLRELYYNENIDIYDNYREISAVKQYLTDHIDRAISLDELEDFAHISKFHLSRLFKKHYGMSPIQYHTDKRLEHAKNLLLYSNLTISKISDACGFSCIHSFTRAFKNKEGLSPSQYKQQIRPMAK